MKRVWLTATVVASALALAACGGSSKSSTSTSSASAPPATSTQTQTQTQSQTSASGGSGAVAIKADPSGQLKFVPSAATAKTGAVTINFTNPSPLSHGLSLQGPGINKAGKVINSGQSSSLTVTLKPGKYTFYCPVPGHRQAGMQGTLTVQ